MSNEKLPQEVQMRMSRAMAKALEELGPDAKGMTISVLWEGDRGTCSAVVRANEKNPDGVLWLLITRTPDMLGRWLRQILPRFPGRFFVGEATQHEHFS